MSTISQLIRNWNYYEKLRFILFYKVNENKQTASGKNNSLYTFVRKYCSYFTFNRVKDYNIKVIDGNEGIGRNLISRINAINSGNILCEDRQDLSIKIINTEPSKAFEKRAKEILQETLDENIAILDISL